ncbi:hypothetical protein [Microcella sp.]|uniref:hypothetical protein n=1 Tax=Microcella sp. TaxID=1913979 RepID=UPI00299F763E|nr:hypothetical protein [Microcella sp.]MDX2026560.1 hypothetical protein [Microcella sp.]
MSDLARFLPLSNRDRGDESGTVGAWAHPAAELLQAMAGVLDAHPALLTAATLRPEVTVGADVRDLLTRLGSPWYARWARVWGILPTPSASVAALDDAALPSAVRERAQTLAAPSARVSIRDLGLVVAVALDLQATHAAPLTVDPLSSGAVALDLALRARHPQRSLVTARTLVATDGDWRVGRGPELRSTGSAIVLFLAGRAGVPPEVQPDAEGSSALG